jgi:4-amino-4-deoxy-L-arabinose transferase-like glycosyltransferase
VQLAMIDGHTNRRDWLWLGCVAALFFALLGTRGLNEPDEGRYAEIAREMAAGGSWWRPHLNGFEHFQKPPLIYWLTAASMTVFGINEWAARLPSALAALGTVLLVRDIGRRVFDGRTGLLAALVLAGGLEFFGMARMLTPDMTMTFWITASVACLVRRVWGGGGAAWGWLFFVMAGLGFLTKGPVAFVVPCSAAFGAWWAGRRDSKLPRLPWIPGLMVGLLIGLSWHLGSALQDPALANYFVGDELVKRVTSGAHGRSKPVWFFVPVLLAGWWPWSGFVVPLAGQAWARVRGRVRCTSSAGLLMGWIAIPFVVLSLSGSKLLTYVLPLFPPMALGLAAWWRRHATATDRRRWISIIFGMLMIPGMGVVVLDLVRPDMRFPIWFPGLLLGLPTAGWIVWRRMSRADAGDLGGVALLSGVVGLLAVAQVDGFGPVLGRQASTRDLAAHAQRLETPDAVRFTFNARACGFGFYLQEFVHLRRDEADIVLEPTGEQARRLLAPLPEWDQVAPGRPLVGLTLRREWGRQFDTNRWELLNQSGDFILIRHRRP